MDRPRYAGDAAISAPQHPHLAPPAIRRPSKPLALQRWLVPRVDLSVADEPSYPIDATAVLAPRSGSFGALPSRRSLASAVFGFRAVHNQKSGVVNPILTNMRDNAAHERPCPRTCLDQTNPPPRHQELDIARKSGRRNLAWRADMTYMRSHEHSSKVTCAENAQADTQGRPDVSRRASYGHERRIAVHQ